MRQRDADGRGEGFAGALHDYLAEDRDCGSVVGVHGGEAEFELGHEFAEGKRDDLWECGVGHGFGGDGDTLAGGCIGKLHRAGLWGFDDAWRDAVGLEQAAQPGLVEAAVAQA